MIALKRRDVSFLNHYRECNLNIQQTIGRGASIKVMNDKKFRVLNNMLIQ